MKIGLYFGSFNPIHVGHLIIANHMAYQTDLDKVWFVLSPQNPLKPSQTLLNEYHRFHLIEKAIGQESRLLASNVEFSLPRPSYTIHTLTYLSEKYPLQEFVVIMGSDSFQNIHRWKNFQQILANYPIYIYRRPGFEATVPDGARIQILEAPLLNISSSQIRTLIRSGKSARYLVPDEAYEYILANRYYL